jgi:hypothetical protein
MCTFCGLCRGIVFFLGIVVAARWWLGIKGPHRDQALEEFLIPVGHIAGRMCILYFFFFARTWVDAKLVALFPLISFAWLCSRWGRWRVPLRARALSPHWRSHRAQVSLPMRI